MCVCLLTFIRVLQTFEIKGVKGRCTHFLIEPFVPHDAEYYISISSHRDYNVVSFSASGGIEIEEGWDEKVRWTFPGTFINF